jgi:hypothetical protein
MKKLVVSVTCGALLMGGILFTNDVQGEDRLTINANVPKPTATAFEPKPTAFEPKPTALI